ncbi:MAG: phosphoribosylpyrophosphate synthetase [Bacteroidia bacterium]
MHDYSTVTEAVNDLTKRGYTNSFKFCSHGIECAQLSITLHPDHFEIVEVYRFDGMTDPADEAVVYAIESKDGTTKGILINGYGIYTDSLSDEMLKKLKEHHS